MVETRPLHRPGERHRGRYPDGVTRIAQGGREWHQRGEVAGSSSRGYENAHDRIVRTGTLSGASSPPRVVHDVLKA
jgi:hypothetical protein